MNLIYLFEWININPNLEFRVFVNNNKITAISQQQLYDRNQILYNISSQYNHIDDQACCLTRNQSILYNNCINHKTQIINQWCECITSFFEHKIKPLITHIANYSIDLAILNDNIPYLIELNSFGKEYSAGSALFHWLLDEQKLYSGEQIYFRYCQ